MKQSVIMKITMIKKMLASVAQQEDGKPSMKLASEIENASIQSHLYQYKSKLKSLIRRHDKCRVSQKEISAF